MDSESVSVFPVSDGITEPVLPLFEVESVLPDVLINGKDINKDGCIREIVVEKTNEFVGHIGFNLTRSQWDPYPWVRSVDTDSPSGKAGLREGDCLLRVGTQDLLGLKVYNCVVESFELKADAEGTPLTRALLGDNFDPDRGGNSAILTSTEACSWVSEVAQLVRTSGRLVTLAVWSCELPSKDWDPEVLFCGPLPGALQRVGACLAAILRAAECPVCGGSVRPPALQCSRGHLLCARCRPRLPACPLCRAPLVPNATRNLLADEVYNCVVESFELKADAEGTHLTRALLGDKAKFTRLQRAGGPHGASLPQGASTSDGFPEHDGPKGIRWGTQRLLDRLLPGRARSTGNISRTRSPTGSTALLADDRDLSRSLSTLDIQRSRAPPSLPSSLGSLACSCSSLPLPSSAFHGNTEAGTISCSSAMSFHCPVDADCTELIKGTLHEHAISKHACSVLLVPGTTLTLSLTTTSAQPALLAHSRWFYPKCERDIRNNGVRVWCWVGAPRQVSSQYQISVEVWPKTVKRIGRDLETPTAMEDDMEIAYEENEYLKTDFEDKSNTGKNGNDRTNGGNTNAEVKTHIGRDLETLKAMETYEDKKENRCTFKDKDVKNLINGEGRSNDRTKKHSEGVVENLKVLEYGIETDKDEPCHINNVGCSKPGAKKHFESARKYADMDENGSDLERWADIPIGDGSSSREDLVSLEEADGPLLTLAAEVLSLIQDPWSQVISSGRSLFLSDRLLQQDVQIRVSIGLRYAEPTN